MLPSRPRYTPSQREHRAGAGNIRSRTSPLWRYSCGRQFKKPAFAALYSSYLVPVASWYRPGARRTGPEGQASISATTFFEAMAAAAQPIEGGGAQLWGIDPGGDVWTLAQVPGGSWTYWQRQDMAGSRVPMRQIAAASWNEASLRLFGIDKSGLLQVAAQAVDGAWGPWRIMSNNPMYGDQPASSFGAIAAARGQLWALVWDGTIWTSRGPDPAQWNAVPTPFGFARALAATTREDETVALYALDPGARFWSCSQTVADGPWTDWVALSNPAPGLPITEIAAAAQSGLPGAHLWGLDQDGRLWCQPQTASAQPAAWQGPWWQGQKAPFVDLAAATKADGTLILSAQTADRSLWSMNQSPDGSWGHWVHRALPAAGAAFSLAVDGPWEAYFLEGPPNDWNGDNGGVHTLVLPGLGLVRLTDQKGGTDPSTNDPPTRRYWPVAISDASGSRGFLYHDLAPLIIGIDGEGSFHFTTRGAINPDHMIAGPVADGPDWVSRPVWRPGEQILVQYDSGFYRRPFELTVVAASQDCRANPEPISSRTVSGMGTALLGPFPPGGYVLKGCVDGRAILGHGRFVVRWPSHEMPHDRHIMSVTAAQSSTALHLIATIMDGGRRSLWHGVRAAGTEPVEWTETAGGYDFPVAEAEMVLHGDGSLTFFALDGDGRVCMLHGDGAWSAAGWNGQPVAFTDLTTSHENGAVAVHALDESGWLWRSWFSTAGWSPWMPVSSADQPKFIDISSAAGYLVGADATGAVHWQAPQGAEWSRAAAPAEAAFRLVDMSWSASRGEATIWAVDRTGETWSGAVSSGSATLSPTAAAGLACPVPITGDFCAVEQRDEARLWGVSGLIQLWGGTRGVPLWDGPSWGGLRLAPSPPIVSLAGYVSGATQRLTLVVAAASASRPSGTRLWSGEHDASVEPPAWDLWTPQPEPADDAGVAALVAAHSGASRLWALDWRGRLSFARMDRTGTLAWQPLATGIVSGVAAAKLPSGMEALWVMRGDGSVEQASAASGFQTFSPLAGIAARDIAAACAGAGPTRRPVVLALDASRAPFDFKPLADGAPQQRRPAFGLAPPAAALAAVEMGTWANGTKLRAFALDRDGWLWVASEDGNDGWGVAGAWEGPRWNAQPARFVRVQTAGDRLFAIDTAGLLWMLDAGQGAWSGPDWGGAANLSDLSEAHPAAAARRTSLAANDTIIRSQRRSETLINPRRENSQLMAYDFHVDDHQRTTSLRVTTARPERRFRVRGDRASYPNEVDRDYYPDRARQWVQVNKMNAIVLPVTAGQAGTDGLFTLLVTGEDLAPGEFVVTRYGRSRADAPHGMVAGARSRHLKINPLLIVTPEDSPEKRATNRRVADASLGLIRNFFGNSGITVAIAQPAEIEAQGIPGTDFSTEPTRSVLRDHGVDDAVNVLWCSRLTVMVAGISGGLPGVWAANSERRNFGVIAGIWPTGRLPSANWVAANTCHEICHLLGLTHESARNTPGNAMLTTVADRGNNLTLEQRWIVQNAVLVEEQLVANPPPPDTQVAEMRVMTTTAGGFTFFDGPGTDAPISLSLLGEGGGVLWAERLLQRGPDWPRGLQAGNRDMFDFTRPAGIPAFTFKKVREARLDWSSGFLGSSVADSWLCDGFTLQLRNRGSKVLASAGAVQSFRLGLTGSSITFPVSPEL
jgi:hypothetical protein